MPQDIDAVSKIIMCWRDRILMLQRQDGNGWELPGGHLNKGERFSVGAKREVFEETGIKLNKLLVILKQKNFRLYKAKPKTLKVKLSQEHTGHKWVSKHELFRLKLSKATKWNLKAILNAI